MEKHIYPECMCLLFISLYRSWAIFLRNIISNFNVNNESASYFNIFFTQWSPPPPAYISTVLFREHVHYYSSFACLYIITQYVTLLSVLPEKFVRRNSKYIHWAIDYSRSRSVLIQCSRTIHFWDEWTLVMEGGLCFNSISQPSLDIWKTSFMHIILARRSSTKVSFSRAGFTFAGRTNFSTYSTLQYRNAIKLFLACSQFPCNLLITEFDSAFLIAGKIKNTPFEYSSLPIFIKILHGCIVPLISDNIIRKYLSYSL
jgi:hypothetical protein